MTLWRSLTFFTTREFLDRDSNMNFVDPDDLQAITESITSMLTEFTTDPSLIPALVDGEALFGALLGAWLVTSIQRNKTLGQRLGSLLLSTGVGYLFMPMALQIAPFITKGGAAFGCALVIIPISIKIMLWLRKADLWEILRRIRGGK